MRPLIAAVLLCLLAGPVLAKGDDRATGKATVSSPGKTQQAAVYCCTPTMIPGMAGPIVRYPGGGYGVPANDNRGRSAAPRSGSGSEATGGGFGSGQGTNR